MVVGLILGNRLPAQAGLMVGHKMWYVYIIKSAVKRWYYVGSTNRPEERLREHNTGRVQSTKAYIPFEVSYLINFDTEEEARKYERRLKDCRRDKEAIIRSIESK